MAAKDISIENIMLVLNELTEKFKESEKRLEKSEQEWQEIREMFKETDRQFKEIARQSKETDKKFQETDRQFKETDKKFQETDRQFKETDKKFQETDRQLKETDKKINKVHGDFTSQWGKLVEAIVRPSCLRLFRARGIDVSRTGENTTIEKDGIKKAEYDAILANGSEVVIVEVKTTLRKKDVEYFVKKLGKVKTYMPEYTNKKVYGAMAAISFDRDADKEAIKKGLFLIKSSGEGVVEIANSAKFKPKTY